MPVADGPDFICIGMQKAGTGWLFDQLQFHPDFWIPPIKELHYLDRAYTNTNNAQSFLDLVDRPHRRKNRLAGRRPWDDRDIEFLKLFTSYRGEERSMERYAALFRFREGKLSGDITPGYSGLTDDTIAAVAERFPGTRLLIIVRDPVSRVWSQISMSYRREKFEKEMLEDERAFRTYLEDSEAIKKVAYASRIVERWRRNAPALKFQHFFFDDVAERPDEARRQILLYLNADPDKASGQIDPGHNRKSTAEKLELTDRIRGVLVNHFADEIRACAAMFGGPAEGWAVQHGLSGAVQ